MDSFRPTYTDLHKNDAQNLHGIHLFVDFWNIMKNIKKLKNDGLNIYENIYLNFATSIFMYCEIRM